MSKTPSAWYVRAWRAIRGFVAEMFAPSEPTDTIARNQAHVHPRIALRGRTMNGGYGP
ncbi:hypothetical protein OCAE111667_06140 [Occultella aeris]|uniref:Uncharacterized protein n=1 Tax=Occultella aeris TaxID=2761496 RepID=A0A7M4DLN6_9MICO|nr:hypothetical protein [Occultella aeris]VZO38208.1 hypothetical protein HALOF300_03053 [Occultella aeris]